MNEHVALVTNSWHEADEMLVVEVACCGLTGPDAENLSREDTRSRHTIYCVDEMSDAELSAAIETHKAAKARQHAGSQRARQHAAKLVAQDAAALAALRAKAGQKSSDT